MSSRFMKRAERPFQAKGLGPSDWLALALATGLGSGLSPFASGTVGTLVAVPLAWALARGGAGIYGFGMLAIFGLGWASAERAGRIFGHSDDGRIVIDEIAGYLLSVAFVTPTWPHLLVGFILFRLFDILKPWPASYFDRKVHNGFGNVMDDLCAGVYARLGVGLWVLFVS